MTSRDRELGLLGELGRALGQLGLGVQVRDGVPGLTVSTSTPGKYVWVFVSESGRNFTWRRDDSKHPVDDVRGAAVEIAKFVTEQDGLNGNGPNDDLLETDL